MRPQVWFLLTVCTRSVFRGSWIHFCLFLLSFLIYPAEIVSNSFSVIISSFFQMNLLFITQSLLLIPILYHTLTICQWFFCILRAILPLFFFIITVLLFVLHPSPFIFQQSCLFCAFRQETRLQNFCAFCLKRFRNHTKKRRGRFYPQRFAFSIPLSGRYPDCNLRNAFRRG